MPRLQHELPGSRKTRARGVPPPSTRKAKINRWIVESDAANGAVQRVEEGIREAHRVWSVTEDANRRQHQFTRTSRPDERPVYESRDEVFNSTVAPRLVTAWEGWQRSKVNKPYYQERWDAYGFLADLIGWLPENRRFAKHVPVKVKGTDHIAAVEKLRGQIADIHQRYSDAEHTPCNADDLIARADAEIDRLAEIGSVRVDARIRQSSPVDIDWPQTTISRPSSIAAEKLVWLFRDEIKAKLAAKIQAETPSVTMSDFERAAELSKLEGEKLSLERQEEAHISAAAEQGQFIARRREANPLAILEIE